MKRFGSELRISMNIPFVCFVAMLVPLHLAAQDLEIGDVAPDFAMQGSDDKVHKLADYRGQAVVLAWFPKAFTEG